MNEFLSSVSKLYDDIVLRRPVATLFVIALLVVGIGWFSKDFALDASSDSLVLERDKDLHYYRQLRARYGTDDYLIITYTSRDELFSDGVLADLDELRSELRALPNVASVTSILDVPLIMSPPVSLSELSKNVRHLENADTDRELAKQELLNSPLYRDLIISSDGGTTAIIVTLSQDDEHTRLREERDSLRERLHQPMASNQDAVRLSKVIAEYDALSQRLTEQRTETIEALRSVMSLHDDRATLHVGGVPMIVSDSIRFIRNDMLVFGTAVFLFLILILKMLFKKRRWTILPLLTCVVACIILIGLLGFFRWRVTVVSSNFVSLVLILCLALTLHFIVRFREIHEQRPEASQFTLVSMTVRKIFTPCVYTVLTTIVAFGSLIISGIRPVIDFGLMMSIGVVVSLALAFTLFPAALMLMKPGEPHIRDDLTARVTGFFATVIRRNYKATMLIWAIIAGLCLFGTSKLTVENRFIDYYKESTEIYQGMQLIDRKLGGTTPLDVVIDAPAGSPAPPDESIESDQEFEDIYAEDDAGSAGFSAVSYWYNSWRLDQVIDIHDYLDDLPHTGKVLSLATAARILQQIEPGILDDNVALSIVYDQLPQEVRSNLITPYLSEDGQQLRFSVRVFESDPELQRDVLLRQIRRDLRTRFGIEDSQMHLSGMLVLYNNMLRSLFSSQILTLAAVIAAIFLMFLLLFRTLRLSLVAIVPTVVSASVVLGLMGWFGIPLDLMTITIAAIAIGIGVDDTIHYVHRFRSEFRTDGNYWNAIERCHLSIGRAMYYTSITIMLGFSILVLSRFVPTIHFGLLTSLAMAIALLANITLLPVLIFAFRAAGKNKLL
ncbi:MAG: MMPL family transporter [Gammaproteobacteria bacterium]|nr:MMPL family transporter [Gammaproteobacteria bacterium]